MSDAKNQEKPLRAAVIGVGHLGRVHAKIYHENPGAELAYVCDSDERRAKSVAVEFDAEALGNWNDLPDDIDVCSIVTNAGSTGLEDVDLFVDGLRTQTKQFPVICNNQRRIGFSNATNSSHWSSTLSTSNSIAFFLLTEPLLS